MKRLFGIFALTPAEQRLVIFVVLLLVAGAWLKHQREVRREMSVPVNSASLNEP